MTVRYRLDRSVRRVAGPPPGLLGGSPLRWFRLTAAGDAVVDRLVAGDDLDGVAADLVDRLVAAGAAHPRPGRGAVPAGDVTVVVPVRDRPEHLDALLSSVVEVASLGSETPAGVVVVDDGSVDAAATAAVADVHGARLVRRARPGGPAAARNTGLAEVTTPFVVFVDSDCAVCPGWLDELLGVFEDPAVALAAPRVVASRGLGALAAYDQARSPLDLGPDEAVVRPGSSVPFVPSAALAARTEVLRDLGGFDERLDLGEDVDLVWRATAAGHLVRYRPEARVVHPPRTGLRPWCAQRLAYGSSAAGLDVRHPGAVAPVVGSPWSLAVWGALLVPGPVGPALAAGVAGGTAVAAVRRFRAAGLPDDESLRLVARGHLGVGRALARALGREWWPLTVVGALRPGRTRQLVVLAAAVRAADAVRSAGGDGPSPVPLVGLAALDDLAYGSGVWTGCVRQRSLRALRPRLVRADPTAASGTPR